MLNFSDGCVAGKIILLNCIVLLIVGITCQCKPQQAELVLVGLSSVHSSIYGSHVLRSANGLSGHLSFMVWKTLMGRGGFQEERGVKLRGGCQLWWAVWSILLLLTVLHTRRSILLCSAICSHTVFLLFLIPILRAIFLVEVKRSS